MVDGISNVISQIVPAKNLLMEDLATSEGVSKNEIEFVLSQNKLIISDVNTLIL